MTRNVIVKAALAYLDLGPMSPSVLLTVLVDAGMPATPGNVTAR